MKQRLLIYVWMLLRSSGGRLGYRRDRSSLFGTLHRMTQTLAWADWSWSNRWTFAVACWQVLRQMQAWLRVTTQAGLGEVLDSPRTEQ